jgi:hypothetical protein
MLIERIASDAIVDEAYRRPSTRGFDLEGQVLTTADSCLIGLDVWIADQAAAQPTDGWLVCPHRVQALWRDDYYHRRLHLGLDGLEPREYQQQSNEDQALKRATSSTQTLGEQVTPDIAATRPISFCVR